MEFLRNFLLLSAVLIFVFIFYRWLLRFLGKDRIPTKAFAYMYPFREKQLAGVEHIRFDMPIRHELILELSHPNGDVVAILFKGVLEKGTSEIPVDFTPFDPGHYELIARLPSQTIRRPVVVI